MAALLALLLAGCAGEDGVDPGGGLEDAPDPPSEVTATATADGIEVTWTDNSEDETAFNIYRYFVGAEGQPRDLLETTPADTERYLDTAVETGRPYGYLVSAENADGESIPVESNAPVYFGSENGGGDDTGNDDDGTGDDAGNGNGDDDSSDGPIEVTSTSAGSSDTECTLIDAIEAANHDEARGGCPAGSGPDMIVLQSGATYEFSEAYGDFDGPTALPSIASTISIEGNGATVKQASGLFDEGVFFRILHVESNGDLELVDATISGGSADSLGIPHDDVPRGGGLYIASAGNASISRTVFTGNLPDAISNSGRLEMQDSVLTGAQADIELDPEAYALHNLGIALLSRVEIRDNTVTGVFNSNDGTLEMKDSLIARNRGSSAYVGAMINEGFAQLINTDVDDNREYDSVAGISNSGVMIFDGGRFSDNYSTLRGGALLNTGTATLRNAVLENNSTMFAGGAISNSGKLLLEDVELVDNYAEAPGGALWSEGADAEVTFGGAVTVAENFARGGPTGMGGGVAISGGLLTVEGELNLSGNTAHANGGGLFVGSAGRAVLNGDVSITQNQAGEYGSDTPGGGVFVSDGGEFEQNGATIENNEPDDFGTGPTGW